MIENLKNVKAHNDFRNSMLKHLENPLLKKYLSNNWVYVKGRDKQ